MLVTTLAPFALGELQYVILLALSLSERVTVLASAAIIRTSRRGCGLQAPLCTAGWRAAAWLRLAEGQRTANRAFPKASCIVCGLTEMTV